jgi:hypothetical protein
MEFIETMIARMQEAPPLAAGSLSALAADTSSEQWIHECVTHSSTQEASFATHLLMRALRVADSIIVKVEAEVPVLAFFENTSRDVLLYETLHYALHGLSDELRRRIRPEAVGASIHHSNLAFLAAGKLGVQHMGEFDVSQHRLERARQYLHCIDRPHDMTECLIGILVHARAKTSIPAPELPFARDSHLEVQICLRGVIHPVASIGIQDGAQRLAQQYDNTFEHAHGRAESPSLLQPDGRTL